MRIDTYGANRIVPKVGEYENVSFLSFRCSDLSLVHGVNGNHAIIVVKPFCYQSKGVVFIDNMQHIYLYTLRNVMP